MRKAVITKHDSFLTYSIDADDYSEIYDKMMEITDNDWEISADASQWCPDAPIGAEYGFREGYITIEEEDE